MSQPGWLIAIATFGSSWPFCGEQGVTDVQHGAHSFVGSGRRSAAVVAEAVNKPPKNAVNAKEVTRPRASQRFQTSSELFSGQRGSILSAAFFFAASFCGPSTTRWVSVGV